MTITKLTTLILLILILSTDAYTQAQSVAEDDLQMDTQNPTRVMIEGLLEVDEFDNNHSIANSETLNNYLKVHSTSVPDELNLQFPCGTFYFGDPIVIQNSAALDWKVTIKLPYCTTIIATDEIKHTSLFRFKSVDTSLGHGQLCFYGGDECNRNDTGLGGIIDTSNTTYEYDLDHTHDYHSNNNTIEANYIKKLIVQGIRFIGAHGHSDTFIAGRIKDVSVRYNQMVSTADAAVYLSGIEDSNDIELTHEAFIWENEIIDTFTGVVCKRGYKSCIVELNDFSYNNSSIGCTAASDDDNPYPCRKLIAKNNSIHGYVETLGSWAQGIILDWCNDGCIVSDNTIEGHFGHGFNSQIYMPDCDVRIFNSSNVTVSNNYKDLSSQYESKICPEGSILRLYGEGNLDCHPSDNSGCYPADNNNIPVTAPSLISVNPDSGDQFPVVNVNNTRDEDIVTIWKDAQCSDSLANPVISQGYDVDIIPDQLFFVGQYSIWAQIERDGMTSACSQAFANYTVTTINPPSSVTTLTNVGDEFPVITVGGVRSGDEVSLWKNADCSIKAKTTPEVSQGTTIDIIPDLLLLGSSYNIRAKINRGGVSSACSDAFATYEVIVNPPSSVTTISETGNAFPVITVGGVRNGDMVSLWKNVNCSIKAKTTPVVSQGTTVDIIPDLLLLGSSYNIRAKIERNGHESLCSTVFASYEVTE